MGKVEHGIKANWKQFTLLVLINGFVGAMVGMERSVLPVLGKEAFGMVASTAILSFIAVFGLTKATSNYYAGAFANKVGRKKLLVIGWMFALPVPLILIYAPSWNWVVFANVLLGINQGLAWSSTVVMKIDLAGERNRGLAMGLNESAGYLAVGAVAFLTGWIASEFGPRPYPFYLGIAFAVIGLFLSWIFVRDTHGHVAAEQKKSRIRELEHVFGDTTWRDPDLGSISQAGLVNNLNDGMMWGLFPLILTAKGFSMGEVGVIVGIYPVVWGLGQLITGKMSDHLSKKLMLFWGMFLQGLVLLAMPWIESYILFILLSFLLGVGTAVVYPTFLAGIADFTNPQQRAKSVGVFRLWRDGGYVVGALLTGWIADKIGGSSAVVTVGGLTLISAFIIQFRMAKDNARVLLKNEDDAVR